MPGPLRILIYGLNYWPELTGVGKFTGEMAAWLVAHGHEIRVISAPPYYPQWRVGEGYSSWRYTRDEHSAETNNTNVYRCPLWVPRRPGGVARLFHLASFAASSAPCVLAQVAWRPDLVMGVVPTLLTAPLTLMAARLTGAKAWLHIQDFEVDAAYDMGLLRSEVSRSIALRLERSLLRRFDRVSSISERMMERLDTKDVDSAKQYYFPNWADTHNIRPMAGLSEFRTELGLGPDSVVALYAGNLGRKQGLELLVGAAKQTRVNTRLVWVIAGDGSAAQELQELAADLGNILWLPLQPVERLNDLLNLADIHVLPQRADAADLVMPSKLTGMLASGRPVVATATAETQVGRLVGQCGVRVAPGDSGALAMAVSDLANQPTQRIALGEAARRFAEKNLNYHAIMRRLEREATALVAESGQAPKEQA